MNKDIAVLIGTGQIGLAILRRVSSGIKVVIGDKSEDSLSKALTLLTSAGFDVEGQLIDIADKESILQFLDFACSKGEIQYFINAAGVSPSQASIETILRVDLYGTAVVLEEVGKRIKEGGSGITISSQSGFRMPALTPVQDELLAKSDVEALLQLDFLQKENIHDTLHAYQLAKRCNEKRVMYEALRWGKRGARINAIAPGIIVTPLAIDEFNGPRGDFYKKMFASCPAHRPGTADEVANLAELVLSNQGGFITGSTFLMDGGATANYYYGEK